MLTGEKNKLSTKENPPKVKAKSTRLNDSVRKQPKTLIKTDKKVTDKAA